MEKTIARTIINFSGRSGDFQFEEGLYTFIASIWEKKGLFFHRHFAFALLFRIDEERKEIIYKKVLKGKIECPVPSFQRGPWPYSNKIWGQEIPRGSLGKHRPGSAKKHGFTYRRLHIMEAARRVAEAKGYSLKHSLWGKM